MTPLPHKVLGPDEGLRLQSGPGRDLVFKLTGDETGGAFDYFVVEVAPYGGRRCTSTTARRKRSMSSPAGSRCGSAKTSSGASPAASPTCHPASPTPS